MRFALLNSGIGLLATTSELHRLHPDADLVISMDPDGMPWGARAPRDIAERSLAIARAAIAYEPDVIVMACNTGTVHAIEALRAEFEPLIPVVGTVPAIKPAAAVATSVAIWATVATTASDYQRQLIADFGGQSTVTPVACPGLATAIDAGDQDATATAIADAARRTPSGSGAIVLGCTEYELAADQISGAVPGAVLFGSAAAVAAQAVRRVIGVNGATRPAQAPGAHGAAICPVQAPGADGATRLAQAPATGTLRVLLSGREGALPQAALRYPQGRELASLLANPDHREGLAV